MADRHDKEHERSTERRMREAIRQRRKLDHLRREEGERSLWQNLSAVGSLGWLVVTPTLLGILLGRWLDDGFQSGILFTGAFIGLGAAMGGYLAWRRMNEK